MTQEVQPLTWQKRTNLEEHQQFFSKINEIIDNLAPTVDEAEAAIAQATAAIASANDAIATANAASAAASAAASQAQTAASTVAGYDTRLTAVEGNVAALGTRMTAAESKNSQQDTAIGALQTADGQNVKISRINEYAVGLTGNQPTITGTKSHVGSTCWEAKNENPSNGFVCKSTKDDVTTMPEAAVQYPMVVWRDKNDQVSAMLRLEHHTTGGMFLMLYMKNTNGISGFKNIEIARNQYS